MSRQRRRVFASQTIRTKALIAIIFSLTVAGFICTLLTFPPALASPIVSDNFNDNSLDPAKWSDNLFSGFTDTSVPLNETLQRLEIGPLRQDDPDSCYHGIRTVNTYNFSGAYSYVELVQAPNSGTKADAMFTIGNNVDNYYRIYVSEGNLIGLKKIAGTKSTLFSIPYDSTNHRFLRIRNDAGNVYLDTAPGSGGVPSTWVQRFTETWSSSISTSSIIFELKGGTWRLEPNPAPGTVIFDNFEVASNTAPAPTVTAISPTSGPTSGGTFVTITGTGFAAGATVSLGGTAATNVTVVSSTSITASTAARAAGTVNVVVTNTDSQSGTLINGYTYSSPPPAPTVTAISPTSGPTSGGTSVTITGTGFASGATVSLGGTSATNVTVVSATSITATTPAHAAGTVNVVVTNTDSQSGTLINGYTYSLSETVIVSDDFNDNSLNPTKWSTNLFSGFTDSSVPLNETLQRLEIGPLRQDDPDSCYHGIRTVNTYNFSGAYSYVELVQAPNSSTKADAMFTIGNNVDNYYRIYVSEGNLIGLKKIAGTKSTLFSIPYDTTNHRFLRIRNDAGNVYLDTAPGSSGVPGSWVQRFTETWSSSISTSSIIFELKGGTWRLEPNPAPGMVIFDNFKAAIPGSEPPSGVSLKMIAANLQHGMSTDGTFHYDQQANNITSTSDLVAAQEVSENDIPNWDAAFTAGGFRKVKFREHHLSTGDGNAIWARNTLTEIQNYEFDLANGTNPTTGSDVVGLDGSDIRRSVVAAKFAHNSKQFYVVSVHLCPSACRDNGGTTQSVQRVTQIQSLLSWIDSTLTGGLPVYILGDLNLTIDTPKQPSGFQFDLFTQAGFSDLWQTGLSSGLAEANWGDRDQDSVPDMPLGLNTRTHDTRRIDYILYKPNSGSITLVKISVPDGRAQCPTALEIDGGNYKACPAVSASNPVQRWDVPEDFGVRLSDHNWLLIELGF